MQPSYFLGVSGFPGTGKAKLKMQREGMQHQGEIDQGQTLSRGHSPVDGCPLHEVWERLMAELA